MIARVVALLGLFCAAPALAQQNVRVPVEQGGRTVQLAAQLFRPAGTAAIPAVAADKGGQQYYAPMPFASIWQGLYGGVHLGWGDSGDADGITGGAQLGYNWQAGQIVYGLETDISASDIGVDERVCVAFVGCARGEGSIDWMGTIRGRVGYATSNVLWFVAGGLALADFDYTEAFGGITQGSVFTGWTLGAGVDIAINPSWIARVEYLYDDFGDKTFFINGDPYRVKLTGDTVRGALMYKF